MIEIETRDRTESAQPPYVDVCVTFRVEWASTVPETTDAQYGRMSWTTILDHIYEGNAEYVDNHVTTVEATVVREA